MSSSPPAERGAAREVDADGWSSCRLVDLAEKVTVGHVGTMAHEYVANGVPFLRSQDIAPLRIRRTDNKHISEAFHQVLRKSALKPGDVVIVRTGRPGTAAVIPAELPVANCADLVIVRPRPELDPRFLAYYINTVAQGYVSAHLVGAVQQHFNVSSAKALIIRLPNLEEQRRIVSVLGAIDDKIDSNDRVARTLAEISDALFAERLITRSGGEGEWTVGDLTTIARFINGRAFTKDANGQGRPILRIKELNGGLSDNTLYSDTPADTDNLARHHDMLFAWSGSLDFHRWYGPESLINQHIFKVVPVQPYPAWFVAGWVRQHMPEFQRIAADKATTMGHIKREHLKQARVVIPPPNLLNDLDAALGPVDAKIGTLAAEIATLEQLRDTLLPKLMTGGLRVPKLSASAAVRDLAA